MLLIGNKQERYMHAEHLLHLMPLGNDPNVGKPAGILSQIVSHCATHHRRLLLLLYMKNNNG
jgi:hypothetical protein